MPDEIFDKGRAAIAKHKNSDLDCLMLCKTMLKKLPNELRDMVYLHLLGQPSMVWRYQTEWAYFPPSLQANPPHWWQADFVGAEFLDELMCYWYRTSYFVVDALNSKSIKSINNLLDENPGKLWKPPNQLINHIWIHVKTSTPLNRKLNLDTRRKRFQDVLKQIEEKTNTAPKTNPKPNSARIYVDLSGPILSIPEAMRYELDILDIIFPVLLQYSKGPVQSMVNGKVFCDDLQKLELDTWRTEYEKAISPS
jgi:hypothetical protein